jgi:dipeptidyl-peptidase-4
MPRRTTVLVLVLASLVSCTSVSGVKRTDGQLLTVERVVSDASLNYRSAGSRTWLEGVEYAVADEEGLGAVDAVSGERRVVAGADALVPAGAEEPLEVASWRLSKGGRRVLLYTNTQRVWRLNTRGDYWVLDVEGGGLRQLGGDGPEASLMFAKFSPDGARVAYVQEHDLWVEDAASGERTRLTEGGSDTLIHGTFDWVYEEELGLHDGFRWSPDGTRIAFWQLDAAGIGSFPLVDELTSPYPTVKWLPYPKAGTTNSAARIGVISAAGGEPTWMQTPGDPRETYLARMEWVDDGRLVLQHLDRAQQVNSVLLAAAEDGAVSELFADRDEAWIDVNDEFVWLDDERATFLWLSERDGWRRPYVAALADGSLTPLHREPHDLMEIEHVDLAARRLLYLAGPDDPTQRYLYSVSLDGGRPARVTPADAPGWNAYEVAPGGDLAFVTSSSFVLPPVTEMIALPSHRPIRTMESNTAPAEARTALAQGARELFRVETESGVVLDGFAMYPPNFDAERSWPVLFYVYGEPWGQTVQDRADLRNELWHTLLTQRGYVVMSLDGRGTPCPRGREWRKCVHGAIGVLAAKDQAEGVRALLERHRWMDRERIGIWGWSGGGSQTLNALFNYPEMYSTGIAVASVPDQRLYDTIYQERYMGTPENNPDGYAAGSPITHADGLASELLLVHGTGDDNVHAQGLWQLADVLVAAGKPFEMMLYPSRSHGIFEREGTREHLFATMTRFLERTLPPGPRN